ncbi:MAG: RNA polymerase sigma factor [Chloroflexota bacterium]
MVAAVLAGDRDAFRSLVERESGPILRTCERILGDRHEAEDAAQETFVNAYRALAGWRGEGPFGAWLARIALRVSFRRASRRRTARWLDPVPPDADDGADAGENRPSPVETDPAVLSIASERAHALREAVASLAEPYRQVVALRFFGELSLDEIARETGRPIGTVKTHLHRGLLRLRADLGDRGGW